MKKLFYLLCAIAIILPGCLAAQPESSDWVPYTTLNGYSFEYPPGHTVIESTDPENADTTIVHVNGVDESGELLQAPPVLQMNFGEEGISVSLWEGIPWDGFPEIMETIEMP
jgi:hypothetical protein